MSDQDRFREVVLTLLRTHFDVVSATRLECQQKFNDACERLNRVEKLIKIAESDAVIDPEDFVGFLAEADTKWWIARHTQLFDETQKAQSEAATLRARNEKLEDDMRMRTIAREEIGRSR